MRCDLKNTVYRYNFRSSPKGDAAKKTYSIRAKIWLYDGTAAWHFITLPVTVSKQIKTAHGLSARGWGSLPVRVTIGATSWKTSIFPDKKAGAYLLPLKADVRKKEALKPGQTVSFGLEI